MKERHLDLFSGIGGFALAASRVWDNHEVVSFCDIEPFAQKVLKKHWPDVPCHDDIKTMKGTDYANIDLLTGGFPCQDLSQAGRMEGLDGARSSLWFEMLRVIGGVKPRWIVIENVPNLAKLGLDRVLAGLAHIGYDAEWQNISAASIGAPHIRNRLWIVAYPQHPDTNQPRSYREEVNQLGEIELQHQQERFFGSMGEDVAYPKHDRDVRRHRELGAVKGEVRNIRGSKKNGGREWWLTEPSVGRVAHGVRNRVDRLKGLGNAIVPQVAEMIFRAIKVYDESIIGKD